MEGEMVAALRLSKDYASIIIIFAAAVWSFAVISLLKCLFAISGHHLLAILMKEGPNRLAEVLSVPLLRQRWRSNYNEKFLAVVALGIAYGCVAFNWGFWHVVDDRPVVHIRPSSDLNLTGFQMMPSTLTTRSSAECTLDEDLGCNFEEAAFRMLNLHNYSQSFYGGALVQRQVNDSDVNFERGAALPFQLVVRSMVEDRWGTGYVLNDTDTAGFKMWGYQNRSDKDMPYYGFDVINIDHRPEVQIWYRGENDTHSDVVMNGREVGAAYGSMDVASINGLMYTVTYNGTEHWHSFVMYKKFFSADIAQNAPADGITGQMARNVSMYLRDPTYGYRCKPGLKYFMMHAQTDLHNKGLVDLICTLSRDHPRYMVCAITEIRTVKVAAGACPDCTRRANASAFQLVKAASSVLPFNAGKCVNMALDTPLAHCNDTLRLNNLLKQLSNPSEITQVTLQLKETQYIFTKVWFAILIPPILVAVLTWRVEKNLAGIFKHSTISSWVGCTDKQHCTGELAPGDILEPICLGVSEKYCHEHLDIYKTDDPFVTKVTFWKEKYRHYK